MKTLDDVSHHVAGHLIVRYGQQPDRAAKVADQLVRDIRALGYDGAHRYWPWNLIEAARERGA